jgi:hypothetical protein
MPPATAIRSVLTSRSFGSPTSSALPSRISWYSPSTLGFQTRARPGWAIAFDRVRAPTSARSRSPSIAIIAVTMCGRSDCPTVTSVARDPNSPIKRRTSSNSTSCGTHVSYVAACRYRCVHRARPPFTAPGFCAERACSPLQGFARNRLGRDRCRLAMVYGLHASPGGRLVGVVLGYDFKHFPTSSTS